MTARSLLLALALSALTLPAQAQSAPGADDAVPPDSCPVLFHWWVMHGADGSPAEQARINSLIGDLGALPEYRVPEASACAGVLQNLAFEGFDLGDPGLRPAQGLAPACDAVLPYVQSRRDRLEASQRARIEGVMQMVRLPLDGGSDDPLACAILHATLVRGDLITAMGAP